MSEKDVGVKKDWFFVLDYIFDTHDSILALVYIRTIFTWWLNKIIIKLQRNNIFFALTLYGIRNAIHLIYLTIITGKKRKDCEKKWMMPIKSPG